MKLSESVMSALGDKALFVIAGVFILIIIFATTRKIK